MMRTFSRRAVRVAAIAIAVASAALLTNARIHAGRNSATAIIIGTDASSVRGPAVPAKKKKFTISGDVSGLYPGVTAPLVVIVSNPFNQPMSVTSITVTVKKPNHVGCDASNLTATNFSGA